MNGHWIAIVFVATALSACSRYTQKGVSMAPTIQPEETIFADPTAYSKRAPQRWEIVIFHPPNEPSAVYAMRVVGLPGERILFTERGILVDGQPIQAPTYLAGIRYLPREHVSPAAPSTTEIAIPSHSYFVVGDNSARANDSRFWGPIGRSSIIGKVTNKK